MNHFATRLHAEVRRKKTPALVGLDPRWDQLPEEIRQRAQQEKPNSAETAAAAAEEFCLRVIDAVSDIVPAVKPQSAFFEECGPAGSAALARVMRYARRQGLIVICDAKRGDIGSTAEAYARAYLAGVDPDAAPYAADALTVNPYLGDDTLKPFVELARARGAGLYVLVRTSNPGAKAYQDLQDPQGKVFELVAASVQTLSEVGVDADGYGSIGAVVGATYPAELQQLRQMMPAVPLLVPGYGAQGGTSADAAAAFDPRGLGALVNSSRGVIFAWQRKPYAEEFGEQRWEEAVTAAAKEMVRDLAQHTPARALT